MIELVAGASRAIVLPEWGGRLHQLFAGGEPLLVAPASFAEHGWDPHAGGCFPMAPWPNRMAAGRFSWRGREVSLPPGPEGNALHGTAVLATWRVLAEDPSSCEMETELGGDWPWAGTAWQRVTLEPDRVHLELEVRAEHEPFPAACGWHPWFRRDVLGSRSVSVQVPAGSRYVLEHHLPTGERVLPARAANLRRLTCLGKRRLDDCFGDLDGPVVVAWDQLRLRMECTAADAHVQVYTPPGSFCIEPQSAPPDAFNLAAKVGRTVATARPGAPVRMETTWTWERTG